VKHTSPLPCGFFPCRDGVCPSFSETTSLTVVHCMSGNAWSYWRLVPMALFDCPRGHRVFPETRVHKARRGLTGRWILPLEIERLENLMATTPARNDLPGEENGISARGAHAACDFK
jgi:hypothetical protein